MPSESGFTSFTPSEFETWIAAQSVARTVSTVQMHHTWKPDYSNFTGTNHFTLQRNMQHHHVANNGWSDIGQHFTIFPDGVIMTGRSLNSSPACIYNHNAGAICIESIGNFDTGHDSMRSEQASAIVRATKAILTRFSGIARNETGVVYHHWFDLGTGARTDGAGNTKSCPGTGFFGGNTVAAFTANFLPLLVGPAVTPPPQPLGWVAVTATALNIRKGPAANFALVADHGPAQLGSVLRVWGRQNGWLKVSNSKDHWVFGQLTEPVSPATVNTADSNGRSGPGTGHGVVEVFQKGEKVYVHETNGGWSRIGPEIWIRETLITLD